ncbi:alpha/beta hydrolase family protein [Streptomyces hawaiiensis]|uniref:alpha/beta hydrolase family protein n=1 Tax=Streptomyces hawaiiensis TaxID=67305 RepID=UPI00366812EE
MVRHSPERSDPVDGALREALDPTGRLPGTLTLPAARTGPVPAVVLLHPFGAWDRDGSLPPEATGTGHVRLFVDLERAFAAAGVAVARFDCRFVTGRDGNGWDPERVTFQGLVDDAKSAYAAVRAHPAVDAERVAFLGVSLGTEVAVAAAEQLGGEHFLLLVAPVAEHYPVRWRWLNVERRTEWLASKGLVDGAGKTDLAAAAGDRVGRSGWWDDFDLHERLGPSADIEEVQALLIGRHHEVVTEAFERGNEDAPAAYWRDWCEQPNAFVRIAGVRGAVRVHVGDDDWTTPPRQGLLFRQAAPEGLDVRVRLHPGLGHLMSPRAADGTRTYGPFTQEALDALVEEMTTGR